MTTNLPSMKDLQDDLWGKYQAELDDMEAQLAGRQELIAERRESMNVIAWDSQIGPAIEVCKNILRKSDPRIRDPRNIREYMEWFFFAADRDYFIRHARFENGEWIFPADRPYDKTAVIPKGIYSGGVRDTATAFRIEMDSALLKYKGKVNEGLDRRIEDLERQKALIDWQIAQARGSQSENSLAMKKAEDRLVRRRTRLARKRLSKKDD